MPILNEAGFRLNLPNIVEHLLLLLNDDIRFLLATFNITPS